MEEPAYVPFLNAVQSRIPERPVNGSSVGLDLCYNAKSAPRFPSRILRFMLITAIAFYVFSYEGSCASENSKPETKAVRVDLIRRDSPLSPAAEARNLSNSERLRRAIQRSHNRVLSLQNAVARNTMGYYSPLNYKNYEFLMQIGIGSPVSLNLHYILDTGSDLIWTQCQPCNSSCITQSDPLYDPSKSSSFKNDSCSSVFCDAVSGKCDALRHCNYSYGYGDSSSTSGNLAYETFSLQKLGSEQQASFPNISFGCGRRQSGDFSTSAGIIGMGRGPLSLVSQIGSSTNNVFSYCMGSITNASQVSPLFLGNTGLKSPRANVTPLLPNKFYPSFYYVDLVGISVARKPVPIPKGTFQITQNGDGGFIVDSGTTLTSLEELFAWEMQSKRVIEPSVED